MPTRPQEIGIDRIKVRTVVATMALTVFLLLRVATASAQKPPQPFAQDWAMLAGQSVFAE